ncbi:MAG: helicase, partial [Burkholderiales bacterium]
MVVEDVFSPGERITHHDYGQGVVLDAVRDGYLRAFFGVGERRVPLGAIRRELSRTERILRAVDGGTDRARKAWLSYEAHALPVMESASALTSAKID